MIIQTDLYFSRAQTLISIYQLEYVGVENNPFEYEARLVFIQHIYSVTLGSRKKSLTVKVRP